MRDDVYPGRETPPESKSDGMPPAYLWLVYLFLRPKRFYQTFGQEPNAFLTAMAAYLVGMASAYERLSSGNAPVPQETRDNWLFFWGAMVVMGALGALIYYGVGGWWYRLRLRWSGAENPDPYLARRIYIFARLVYALPILMSAIQFTFAHDNPYSTFGILNTWFYIAHILLLWSVYVSYRGVRTVFEVKPGLARLWFLILPLCIYMLVIAALLLSSLIVQPPDIANASRYEGNLIDLEYPGNWRLSGTDDLDEGVDLWIAPNRFNPLDAGMHILVFGSVEDNERETQRTLDSTSYEYDFELTKTLGTFNAWGPMTGHGVSARGTFTETNNPAMMRVFVGDAPGAFKLEVREVVDAGMVQDAEAGFELIRQSIQLIPPPRPEPMLINEAESGMLTLRAPEGWEIDVNPWDLNTTGENPLHFQAAITPRPLQCYWLAMAQIATDKEDSALRAGVQQMESLGMQWNGGQLIESWGNFQGQGLTGEGRIRDDAAIINVFASQIEPNRFLTILEYHSEDTETVAKAIRTEVKAREAEPPSEVGWKDLQSPPLRSRVPENWTVSDVYYGGYGYGYGYEYAYGETAETAAPSPTPESEDSATTAGNRQRFSGSRLYGYTYTTPRVNFLVQASAPSWTPTLINAYRVRESDPSDALDMVSMAPPEFPQERTRLEDFIDYAGEEGVGRQWSMMIDGVEYRLRHFAKRMSFSSSVVLVELAPVNPPPAIREGLEGFLNNLQIGDNSND